MAAELRLVFARGSRIDRDLNKGLDQTVAGPIGWPGLRGDLLGHRAASQDMPWVVIPDCHGQHVELFEFGRP